VSHGIDGLLSIGISGFFGGLASVGQLLSSAKILTRRRIAASMVAGVTSGIVSGALFGIAAPEMSQNYLLVSGAGSIGGVLGVHALLFYFMSRYAPEILKSDGQPDSMTVEKMIDSGEFSEEEIRILIQQAREKRQRLQDKL
jgi:siroheme synthase